MAVKDKVVIRLTAEQRVALRAIVQTGRHPAAMRRRAQILLKSDRDGPDAWSDPQIALVVGVVDRHHRLSVLDRDEACDGLSADPLGGVIRSHPLRIRCFESLQFTQQAVIFVIGDDRSSLDVIQAIVVFKLAAKFKDAYLRSHADIVRNPRPLTSSVTTCEYHRRGCQNQPYRGGFGNHKMSVTKRTDGHSSIRSGDGRIVDGASGVNISRPHRF